MTEIKLTPDQYRYGIAEWYGLSFIKLSPAQRRAFALIQQARKRERPPQPCPPRLTENPESKCSKEGGVCSLRLYQRSGEGIAVAPGELGEITTTCPHRFKEGGLIFRWVGETILGHPEPEIVKEIGFLEKPKTAQLREERGGK
jgi:hypothetical protein